MEIDIDPDGMAGMITVASATTPAHCDYTGERVPRGETILIIGDVSDCIVVRLGSMLSLQDELDRLDGSERCFFGSGQTLEIIPGGEFNAISGRCAACLSTVSADEPFVGWITQAQTEVVDEVATARLHVRCAATVSEMLDRVWDHAPDILANEV